MSVTDDLSNEHLSDFEVVALLEGRAKPESEAHLLCCRACNLLYEASVIARAHELISAVERRPRRRGRRWIVAASGLAAAAAIVLALLPPRTSTSLDFRLLLPPELHPGVETMSGQWMVFPGFEDVADREIPLERSLERAPTRFARLADSELDRMEAGTAAVEDYMRGIAALLADDEVTSAWRWTARATAAHPGDERLLFLRALASQRIGDLGEAARILEDLCASGEGSATFCLDLVLVRVQLGHIEEARVAAQRLRHQEGAELLVRRAEMALERATR